MALTIDNDSSSDQLWVVWGIRSRNYDSAATAALYFEAETRLPQGGATLAARSGASGGTVVRQGTLTTGYQSMMSLASSGTAYCSHVGSYRVFGRVYDPGGTAGRTSGGTVGNVSLAFEWATGDFVKVTRNDGVSPPVINAYSILDFGQVHIPKAATGAQRWDARVIAKGTDTNQSVDVDCVWLVPTDEGSGQAQGVMSYQSPTVFSARDEFNQATSGTITGKVLPIGGTWAAAGDADDYTFTANHAVQRTAVSDSGPHFALAGTATYSTIAVQADLTTTNAQLEFGMFARYVDTSNYLSIYLGSGGANVDKVLGGTITTIGSGQFNAAGSSLQLVEVITVRAAIDAQGRFWVWAFPTSGTLPSAPLIIGQDDVLATGGTLASGRIGLFDWQPGSTAGTRTTDNFQAFVPTIDAAIYANQSIRITSSQAQREDSSGTVWAPVGKYEGSYFKVPASGQEGRTCEVIVKASRGIPGLMADPGIDDLSAQLAITPRFLDVPES